MSSSRPGTRVPLTPSGLIPSPEAVLVQMGVPRHGSVPDRVHELVAEAIDLLGACVQPAGLLSEMSREEFAAVYAGEGRNAPDTPAEHIFPDADHVAIYAVTLGAPVSDKIDELCTTGDIALGGALDAAASVAADKGTGLCETYFQAVLGEVQPLYEAYILAYSPGYCGWHVSGQRKLFQVLWPEQIGITLNEMCLMTPIKSVSGVLMAGSQKMHRFTPHWEFCETCTTHSCLQRMKKLAGPDTGGRSGTH